MSEHLKRLAQEILTTFAVKGLNAISHEFKNNGVEHNRFDIAVFISPKPEYQDLDCTTICVREPGLNTISGTAVSAVLSRAEDHVIQLGRLAEVLERIEDGVRDSIETIHTMVDDINSAPPKEEQN